MHKVPSVQVVLRGSRIAGVAVLALATSTFAVVLSLPLEAWQQGVALVALALWAFREVRDIGVRREAGAVRSLRLHGDRSIDIECVDETRRRGIVVHTSCVGAHLTTVVWREPGRRLASSVLVLPDMLPAEEFRRLRVLMRYARSDDAAGVPESHA